MKFYVLSLFSLLLLSCQFEEKIIFDKNGSGEFELNIDASPFLKTMSSFGDEKEKNKNGENQTKVIDSTFYFNDLISQAKDSLPDNDPNLKKLEKFKDVKFHILMNQADNKMVYSLQKKFHQLDKLNDLFRIFEEQSDLSKNKLLGNFSGMGEQTYHVSYSMEKRLFKREVIIPNLEYHKKISDSLTNKWSFLDNSSYDLTYTFPKEIKSTTLKGALFSDDRKTISKSVSFLELTKYPEILDFEVELTR